MYELAQVCVCACVRACACVCVYAERRKEMNGCVSSRVIR